jgi:hypothetical protein
MSENIITPSESINASANNINDASVESNNANQNPKNVKKRMVQIGNLKPRPKYNIDKNIEIFNNKPRYKATATSVYKQLSDCVSGIIQKTQSFPNNIKNTYIDRIIRNVMYSQETLMKAYARQDDAIAMLRYFKLVDCYVTESCGLIKSLKYAGFFNKDTASNILSYFIKVSLSLGRMINSKEELINKYRKNS